MESRFTAVVYSAGVNEKLLGDFIRKHNCREKIFCTCLANRLYQFKTYILVMILAIFAKLITQKV